LKNVIENLDLAEAKNIIHPLVKVGFDVARETAEVAINNQIDLILLGWHRPAFSDNRLGGRVGKILNNAPVDVAVFVAKEKQKFQSLLVPYTGNIHDDLGLSLALRLLLTDTNRHLKILRFTENNTEKSDFSYNFRKLLDLLPQESRFRLEIIDLENTQPMQAVIDASENVDLTIAGTNPTWGIEKQTLGYYTDLLAQECHSSLLITRRHSQITTHLTSLTNQLIIN
jgi:hypothetical protein